MRNRYVTAKELGAILGMHESTIYRRLTDNGVLKRIDGRRATYEILKGKETLCRYEYNRAKRRVVVMHENLIEGYLEKRPLPLTFRSSRKELLGLLEEALPHVMKSNLGMRPGLVADIKAVLTKK